MANLSVSINSFSYNNHLQSQRTNWVIHVQGKGKTDQWLLNVETFGPLSYSITCYDEERQGGRQAEPTTL